MSKNTYGSSHKREGQEPAKTNMMIASVIGPYSNNAYKSGISPKNKIEEQNKVQILIPSPNLPLHRLPIITRNWS